MEQPKPFLRPLVLPYYGSLLDLDHTLLYKLHVRAEMQRLKMNKLNDTKVLLCLRRTLPTYVIDKIGAYIHTPKQPKQ